MNLGRIHAEGQRVILEKAAYYRLAVVDIPERYWLKLDTILVASSDADALAIQKKVVDSFFVLCLRMWADKEIKGPHSAQNLEKEAKKADGLVNMLRDKKGEEAAQKQIQKAKNLRKEAETLRGKK